MGRMERSQRSSHRSQKQQREETPVSQASLQSEPIEENREFKAHVYQHLVELQRYLSPDAQIAVFVDPESEKQTGEVSLSLVTQVGDERLETEGRHPNLYAAFSLAKDRMLGLVNEWFMTMVDTTERDAEVQALISGAVIH